MKPDYNWVIGTNNDKVMEKFTKRYSLKHNFEDIMRNTRSKAMQKKEMEWPCG